MATARLPNAAPRLTKAVCSPDDVRVNPEAGKAIFETAQAKFGIEYVCRDDYQQKREATRFPVLLRDRPIAVAEELSEVLQHWPVVAVDYLLIRPDLLKDATVWLAANRE